MRTRLLFLLLVVLLLCGFPLATFADKSAGETEILSDEDLLLLETENAYAIDAGNPTLQYNFELTGTYAKRIINYDSRLNPENEVLDLNSGLFTFEVDVIAWDYLLKERGLRWFTRTYSFLSSDKVVSDDQEDVSNNQKNEELRSSMRFDEIFLDLDRGQWFASLGKRRINWGHARAFNPVNVVVPKRDPLDPKQETEGVQMAWFNFTHSPASFDLIWTRDFDKSWNSDLNRWGARFGWTGQRSDLSFYYFDGQRCANESPFERMLGFSFSAGLWDVFTLYSEVAWFAENHHVYYDSDGTGRQKDEDFWQAVTGVFISPDATSFLSFFQGEAFLTLELFYNQAGYSAAERENFFSALDADLLTANRSVSNTLQSNAMSPLYFLMSYSNSFHDRYQINLDCLLSQDESSSTKITGKYNLTNYNTIEVSWIHNRGDRDSEYGNAFLKDIFEIALIVSF